MTPTKSKTLATWIALIGGPLGLHRFYLGNLRDSWGWVHAGLTFLGVLGVQRVLELGQDDRLAWLLMPLGGTITETSSPAMMLLVFTVALPTVMDTAVVAS